MKKLFFLSFLVLCVSFVKAQNQTDPTSVKRVTVWDKPRTDSFLLKKDVRPVLAYTSSGQAVYILPPPELFEKIIGLFEDPKRLDSVPVGYYLGYEYVVDYLSDFSLFSKKELREMTASQRLTAQAFNSKNKYTVLAESPYPILGMRVKNAITGEVTIQEVVDGGGGNQPLTQKEKKPISGDDWFKGFNNQNQ